MAKYKSDNITDAFWVEDHGFTRGRDPLGIQNCSVTLYSQLLPGLTNLTGHIRYYSFYCWILYEYDKPLMNGYKQDHNISQYNFIRRAELLMAFIMSGKNVRSIVGSNTVEKINFSRDNGETYDFAEYADYEGDSTKRYWTWVTGAFGQYYFGSLRMLGLVTEEVEGKNSRFYLTRKGKFNGELLAKAFIKNFEGKKILCEFLNTIKEGIVDASDIQEFDDLSINNIIPETEEWKLLLSILTDSESPGSTNRTVSMQMMINALCNNGIEVADFPCHVFDTYDYANTNTDWTKRGWCYYYIVEALHYAMESMFWAFLYQAEGKFACLMTKHFESCVGIAMRALDIAEGSDQSFVDYISNSCQEQIPQVLDNLKASIKKKLPDATMGYSIKLMTAIKKEYDRHKDIFSQVESRMELTIQNGNVSGFVTKCFEINPSLSIRAGISFILKQIVKEHYIAAYRKMAGGNSCLLKFVIDNGYILHVDTIEPQFTSPRTLSLYNYINDLSLINGKEITQLGKLFLSDEQ